MYWFEEVKNSIYIDTLLAVIDMDWIFILLGNTLNNHAVFSSAVMQGCSVYIDADKKIIYVELLWWNFIVIGWLIAKAIVNMLIPNLERFSQQILVNVLSTRPFTYPLWYWNVILSTNTMTTMRYIWDYAINLMDEIGNPLSQPGLRFTNCFSIAIEIW